VTGECESRVEFVEECVTYFAASSSNLCAQLAWRQLKGTDAGIAGRRAAMSIVARGVVQGPTAWRRGGPPVGPSAGPDIRAAERRDAPQERLLCGAVKATP
jgi:hypothetical protein